MPVRIYTCLKARGKAEALGHPVFLLLGLANEPAGPEAAASEMVSTPEHSHRTPGCKEPLTQWPLFSSPGFLSPVIPKLPHLPDSGGGTRACAEVRLCLGPSLWIQDGILASRILNI